MPLGECTSSSFAFSLDSWVPEETFNLIRNVIAKGNKIPIATYYSQIKFTFFLLQFVTKYSSTICSLSSWGRRKPLSCSQSLGLARLPRTQSIYPASFSQNKSFDFNFSIKVIGWTQFIQKYNPFKLFQWFVAIPDRFNNNWSWKADL